MTRSELEHIIRAAGAVADETRLIIIGSQAILAQFPNAPVTLRQSMEADVIAVDHPEKWNLIDGTLGEGSPFHETFGYYADGVEETTACLPNGWKDRLVSIRNENTRGITGLCLEIHDLLIAKYLAGREKDLAFARQVVKEGLVRRETLLERLSHTPLTAQERQLTEARIARAFECPE
jgi:hypothetical protein